MKKLTLIFCLAFLLPQYGALAHQENHVHSQWVKQQISQMQRTIAQLSARIDQLAGGSSQSPNSVSLNETCGPNEQNLCSRTCSVGFKVADALCIGRGNMGKTYHSENGVTCYCFNENDPGCQVRGLTASCLKR